jgi:hypothetical protein
VITRLRLYSRNKFMIKTANFAVTLSFVFLLFIVTSCGSKNQAKDDAQSNAPSLASAATPVQSTSQHQVQLPVRFQTPGYVTTNVQDDGLGDSSSEYQIKVGATIRSTAGPQPLWEVMKRLVNLKGMTVSWASDVDQAVPVDVDISASDNFYDAIAGLLFKLIIFMK